MNAVSGFFCVTGVFNKEKIHNRLVIAGFLGFVLIGIFVNSVRGLRWWGAGIFTILFLLLLSYVVSVLRKKHGIYLDGFLMTDNLVQRGSLYATTEELATVVDGRDRKKVTELDLVPQQWKAGGKGVVYSTPDSTRFVFSMANQENFQSTYNVSWHISRVEVLEDLKTKSLLLLSPGNLCVIENNHAVFYFQKDDSKTGEVLLSQLSMLGKRLKNSGSSAWNIATVKVIPEKTNKATAFAFGAIGGLVASIKDEQKKKKFKDGLKAGEFSIFHTEADRSLISLIEELNWDLTI